MQNNHNNPNRIENNVGHEVINPEEKNGRLGKKLAKTALAFLIISGVAFTASQTEFGKKFLGTADAVHSGEITPDLVDIVNAGSSDGIFNLDDFEKDPDNPDVMTYDNGAKAQEVVKHTVEEGKTIVIKSGANLRREPAIGTANSHVIATMAKANQDIILTGVSEYSVISDLNDEQADPFMVIEFSSLPMELQKEMNFGPDVTEIYIKLDVDHSEVVVEDIDKATDIETAVSVSE